MKKKPGRKKKTTGIGVGILLTAVLAFVSSAFFYTIFLRSATNFDDERVFVHIPSQKKDRAFVKKELKKHIKPLEFTTFLALAEWTGYWKNIKPGRYTIEKNSGIYTIFRRLQAGDQTPLKLTINKFRTRKDMAQQIGSKLECDAPELMQFFNTGDSLAAFGVDAQTLMTLIIPNTYELYWTTTPRGFVERMKRESSNFWNTGRIAKAEKIGLSTVEVYNLASIIEEETNFNPEKKTMASVYLNRMQKGMTLGADPTIKFALGDFSIKRITQAHIKKSASSPYNTYTKKGLPPGPICTPSIASIDAVLDAEKTDYLYFCAKEDFSGSHNFAATPEEHFANARKYRKALDRRKIR